MKTNQLQISKKTISQFSSNNNYNNLTTGAITMMNTGAITMM